MGICVGERLKMEVVLRYWSYKLSKSPIWTSRYPFGVFLRKNGSLSELRHQEILALLVTGLAFYKFVTVKQDAFGTY